LYSGRSGVILKIVKIVNLAPHPPPDEIVLLDLTRAESHPTLILYTFQLFISEVTVVANPPPAHLIRTAADLRAAGNAWERVADEVEYPLDDVREWPQRYPMRWRKAIEAAVRRTLAEATAEAVLYLRKQLRSENDKSVREASLKLAQVCILLEKARRPAKGDTQQPTSPPGYADRLLNYVRGMTDEQLAEEMAEEKG
jgi:hypothetical protein